LLRNLKKDEKELRILMLGLDNSGKTTALKKLADESPAEITPTQGFNIKSVQSGGFKLNVWDIGGQKHIRPYWKNYYAGTDAMIYVIDAADKRRVDEAAEELDSLASEDELKNVPILVLANKQDLLGAMDAAEIMKELNVTEYKDRWCQVKAVSAKTGENLQDAVAEVLKVVKGKEE